MCILLARPKTKYLTDAAYLAVEILSEEDRMTRTMERLDEFYRKGVPNIWVIDPRLQTMAAYSNGTLNEIRGSSITTSGDPASN